MANSEDIEEKRFEAAVKVMRSLPENGPFEPSDDMLVMFYSYYKQATNGPCNTAKPNGWDQLGKAKWEAWKALGNMSKEQAMKEYVQEIKLILETMPVTEEVEDLLDALEPFYEVVENEDDNVANNPVMPPTGNTDEETDEEEQDDEDDKGSSSFQDMEDYLELDDAEVLNNQVILKMMGRTESQVYNGSMEHIVSPTNISTHSSLNTEEEEEELVCSEESSLELCTGTGQHDSEVSEQKPHSNKSDNVVYMEPLRAEMGSGVPKACLAALGMAGAKSREEPGGNIEAQCRSQDGKPQEAVPPPSNIELLGIVQPDSASTRRGRGCELLKTDSTTSSILETPSNSTGVGKLIQKGLAASNRHVNKQIAMALSQLQENMKAVLQRLNVLETQTSSRVNNHTSCSLYSHMTKKHSQWWPLDVHPSTMAMLIVWPFVLHWLVQLYRQARRGRL